MAVSVSWTKTAKNTSVNPRRNKGKTFSSIISAAGAAAVCALPTLQAENIIRRVPVYGESGVQKASKYIYTGDKSRLTGKEPCIDKIYDPANPMKLRDFDWKGYWTVRDDYLFFHYEEVFGCDGPSRALNERARKNGCTSPEDEFENIQEADIESDLFDEEDAYEYIFPSSRKKNKLILFSDPASNEKFVELSEKCSYFALLLGYLLRGFNKNFQSGLYFGLAFCLPIERKFTALCKSFVKLFSKP